ncbi:hypothetical protein UFOVP972_76 [uncultured Caudovirales phage]|uniref:Uncharacterized protein n=1 Tax=uncultured Caudovirales phage TaxID=2100421 RepID=A0A6J5PS69_9CAUD|nr:hypothetical protein UFOVP972_76 [uncultured Caudovirales phage]
MKNHIKGFSQFVNESAQYTHTFESENKESMKIELIRKIDDAMEEEGLSDEDLANSIESVLRQAEENGYDGDVEVRQSRTGRIVLLFKPTPSRFHRSDFYKNVVRPMVGGMSGGHTFGGGRGKY